MRVGGASWLETGPLGTAPHDDSPTAPPCDSHMHARHALSGGRMTPLPGVPARGARRWRGTRPDTAVSAISGAPA